MCGNDYWLSPEAMYAIFLHGFAPNFVFLDRNIEDTLSMIDDIYVTGAYNSLSIEGYKVTTSLLKKSPETILAR